MSGITTDAINKIIDLAEPNYREEHGATYSDKRMHRIEEPQISSFQTHSLRSILDYLDSNLDNLLLNENERFAIHIESPRTVELVSGINKDKKRNTYISAILPNSMKYKQLSCMTQEEAIVNLQTNFEQTENLKLLLKIVSQIVKSDGFQSNDDGVSQQVVLKSGAALKDVTKLPNPIELVPYRTFREVAQPPSKFVVRLNQNMELSLFEAEGERWQLDAIENIRKYYKEGLEDMLPEDIWKRISIIA